MSILINRGVFHYVGISFLAYVAIYITYMNLGFDSKLWNTIYFVNENIFVINLLFAISRIIDERRLRYFAYSAIGFKTFVCVIDALAYAGIAIMGHWPEVIIASYWILTLTFYLYGSSKRLREQEMD